MSCPYIYKKGSKKNTCCNAPVRQDCKHRLFCGKHTPQHLQIARNISNNKYRRVPELPTEIWSLIATIIPGVVSRKFCTCSVPAELKNNSVCKCITQLFTTTSDIKIFLAIRSLNRSINQSLGYYIDQLYSMNASNTRVCRLSAGISSIYMCENIWNYDTDHSDYNRSFLRRHLVITASNPNYLIPYDELKGVVNKHLQYISPLNMGSFILSPNGPDIQLSSYRIDRIHRKPVVPGVFI
jgi:hypothetical protein